LTVNDILSKASVKKEVVAPKVSHSSLPWKIDENEDLPLGIIEDNEYGEGVAEIGCAGSNKKDATPEELATAKFIVQSANSHYELLRVVKKTIDGEDIDLEEVDKIIAKAEGK
jgi:hypothetical protein